MSVASYNIKRLMVTLTNTSWRATTDEAGKSTLNTSVYNTSKFINVNDWLNSMEASRKSYTQKRKTTKQWLLDCCGINLDNEDTGAITGSDAGNATVKTDSSVIYEPSGSTTIYALKSPSGYGVTVNWDSNYAQSVNSKIAAGQNSSSMNNYEKILLYASNWWLTSSLDLIYESYGINFNTARGEQILNVNISWDIGKNTLGDNTGYSTYSGKNDKNITKFTNKIRLNGAIYNSITDREGSEEDTTKLDRVFAHELTHGVMRANIYTFNSLPDWFIEGSAELVHGIDDQRPDSITKVAASASDLDIALAGNSSVSSAEYAVGYIALRYFAKNANNDAYYDSSQTVLKVSGDFTVGTYNIDRNRSRFVSTINHIDAEKAGAAVRLEGNAGNNILLGSTNGDSVLGGFGVDTVRGGAGNDSLCGEYDADEILGGDGNDTIWGGRDFSNDVIGGGTGDDFLAGEGGDDFLAGEDGNDRIYGGVGCDFMYGGDGDDYLYGEHDGDHIYGDGGNDIIFGGDGDDFIDGGNGSDWIYGEAGNDVLFGNEGNDVLFGGYGANLLVGSFGDDTLYGGEGQDTFLYGYGDGNDRIWNYQSNYDIVSLQNVNYDIASNGVDVVISTDTGSMILEGAAGRTILVANRYGVLNRHSM